MDGLRIVLNASPAEAVVETRRARAGRCYVGTPEWARATRTGVMIAIVRSRKREVAKKIRPFISSDERPIGQAQGLMSERLFGYAVAAANVRAP
jgi:hypothetical protein